MRNARARDNWLIAPMPITSPVIDTSQAGYLPSFTVMSYPLMRSSPRAFLVTRLVAP